MRRTLGLVIAAVVVTGGIVQVGLGTIGGPAGTDAPPSSVTASGSPSAASSGSIVSPPPSGPAATEEPDAGASSSPSASPSGPLADVPIVAATSFRAPWTTTNPDEVAAVVAGESSRYEAIELIGSEADAIVSALGIDRRGAGDRLVTVRDAGRLGRDLAAHRDRLAFLRADEIGPNVRALGWNGRSLFGVGRVRRNGAWPLTARLPRDPGSGGAFQAKATWTLVAGGDILLDRGVAKAVKIEGKGVDYPWNGGTADITSRYCCSSFGWRLPRSHRTGNAGAMGDLLRGADLAVANFENPAPNSFAYHTHGTVFSADPKLIAGLRDAGIDAVSIANNHIGDAGRAGVVQTRRNLARYGIEAAGAGADAAQAHEPALLHANGVTVAILGYDSIAKYYNAGSSTPGSARLTKRSLRRDVARARAAGADVVIVYPHWGTEYDPTPFGGQRSLAHDAIDAGADMVIGNHAHWAGAVEIYHGRPIWYALGNFVFDQTWSEPTMEGMTLELTFRGRQLVQAWMHPHLILGGAQPNFLDPAGDGRVVMGQVFAASKGLLPW
ncbi:MAG TPA: CapA family protein [Candidatus Limnocylindrales bacterium]|nr:CapA family protein [Candidatus Limnocylindrales bacterium]